MTLILVTASETGEIDVVADTLFGTRWQKASEVCPKIFLVPVTLSDLDETASKLLPQMGFTFAGNTMTGQFTHALASTCLQNLASPALDSDPDVEDVARFYAKCATEIFEELRRHKATDAFGFTGVIFGYSAVRRHAVAYEFEARVAADGTCEAPVRELYLEHGVPYALGSGAEAAHRGIAYLRQRGVEINPFSLMYHIIEDDSVPSVGGEFQAATADASGVSLRPVMHFLPKPEGGLSADHAVMGINLHRLGLVAGYVPIGRPKLAQSPRDLEHVLQQLQSADGVGSEDEGGEHA